MTEITIDIREDLLNTIQSISRDNIITPTVPIAIYLQEAENLAVWANDDLDQLSKVGISSAHIEDLKERIEACRIFQTEWIKLKNIKPTEQKLWEESRKLAIELRGELIFTYKYAFKDDKTALKEVKKIKKQNKTANLVATLHNLYRIGNTYPELLEKISFDFNQLKDLSQLAYKLKNQRSEFVATTPDKQKFKHLRNQSYTYLKHLIDEIKDAGKYVFAKNKERLQGYHSRYYKDKKALLHNKQAVK